MENEQYSAMDIAALHQEVRAIWNHNAAFWDERMGDNGSDFQHILPGRAGDGRHGGASLSPS